MSWTGLSLPQQVEGVMWFVVAGFSFILAVLSFRRYKKSQVQSRPFFLGLAAFTSTYGVARVLENIRKYFIALSLTDIADAWRAGSQITGLDLQLRIGYFVVVWMGIAIFFANLEKFVFERKTKYLLTLAAVVEGTMSIALYQVQGGTPEFFIILWTSAIGFFIPALALIVLFAKIAKNSVGSVRTAVVLALTGFLLFVVGMLADLPESWYIGSSFLPGWLTGIAAPIILFAGLAILIIAFEKMFTEDINKE